MKIEYREVELKNFLVYLMKWSCLRLSINMFSGSRCIRVSETSHQGFLMGLFFFNLKENITVLENGSQIGSFLLNLSENITDFEN